MRTSEAIIDLRIFISVSSSKVYSSLYLASVELLSSGIAAHLFHLELLRFPFSMWIDSSCNPASLRVSMNGIDRVVNTRSATYWATLKICEAIWRSGPPFMFQREARPSVSRARAIAVM